MSRTAYNCTQTLSQPLSGGSFFYARKAVTPQSDRLSCVNALVAQRQSAGLLILRLQVRILHNLRRGSARQDVQGFHDAVAEHMLNLQTAENNLPDHSSEPTQRGSAVSTGIRTVAHAGTGQPAWVTTRGGEQ